MKNKNNYIALMTRATVRSKEYIWLTAVSL